MTQIQIVIVGSKERNVEQGERICVQKHDIYVKPLLMYGTKVKPVSRELCPETLQIPAGKICTLNDNDEYNGPCEGDNGGPLFCKYNDVFYQMGIISTFPSTCTEEWAS